MTDEWLTERMARVKSMVDIIDNYLLVLDKMTKSNEKLYMDLSFDEMRLFSANYLKIPAEEIV